MNKVFKVVWSATKHAYVVTSELAKSHQKSATTIVAAVILVASFSGGVANASSPEDWARADLIGSQRWLTPDQNAWGHMQDQHQVDPQQLDQQQQQQQQQPYYVLDIRHILYIISTITTLLFLPDQHSHFY